MQKFKLKFWSQIKILLASSSGPPPTPPSLSLPHPVELPEELHEDDDEPDGEDEVVAEKVLQAEGLGLGVCRLDAHLGCSIFKNLPLISDCL